VLVAADTHYDLLGVSRNADVEEIRGAYRRLSKIYHPDLGGTPAFFRMLQDAHETLTDPFQRSLYDRSLIQSGSRAQLHEPTSDPFGQAQTSAQRAPRQSNSQDPAGPGDFVKNGFTDTSPEHRRRSTAWSRGIHSASAVIRGRHRRKFVMALWITSLILAGALVAVLLDAARGFVLFILILVLILVVALVTWGRRASRRRRAALRARLVRATVELNRTAREAAERQRGARATATGQPPSASSESAPASSTEEDRITNDAAHSGESDESVRSRAQFEYLMAVLLEVLGVTDVRRVNSRDDSVVDVTARDSVGRAIVARCRRSTRTEMTGALDVRQFIDMAGAFQQKALKLLVTTSDFTSDARNLAERHGIQLINGPQVEGLVRKSRRVSSS
jgi:curved DNA-binding protein CbpA